MITIPASEIKFLPEGKCIWVLSVNGNILLQLSTSEKIIIKDKECENTVCHADIFTTEQITIEKSPLQLPQLPKEKFISIPAGAIELAPYGNTIWVQSPVGATILRIKSTKFISISPTEDEMENEVFYTAIHVSAPIDVCLVAEIAEQLSEKPL